MRKSKTIKGATGSGASAMDQAAQAATDALRQLAQAAEDLKQALTQIIGTPGGAGANPGGFASASAALASVNQATSDLHVSGAAALQNPNVASVLQMASADSWGSLSTGPTAMVGMGGAGSVLPPRDDLGRFMSPGGNGMSAISAMGAATGSVAAGAGTQDVSVAVASLNPFANQKAIGPTSTLGTPGLQLNTYLLQQEQIRAQQQLQLRTLGVGIGITAVSSGLNLWANQTASGEYDPMAAAGVIGGAGGAITGGIAGALIGSVGKEPEPGLGALIGSGLGRELGSAAAQAAMAPFMRTRNAILSLTPVAARMGVDPYAIFGPSSDHLDTGTWKTTRIREADPNGLSALAHRISMEGKSVKDKALISSGIYTGTDIISGPQIADTFATIGAALIESGMDTHDTYGFTENVARKYKMLAPQMARMAYPVLANANRMGQNSTDLLLGFGANAYGAAMDVLGRPDLASAQREAYGAVQRDSHAAEIAGLQARGSGAASVAALDAKLSDLAKLPGGKDSLAYAQTAAQRRDAGRTEFAQEDILAFGLPMTHLQGQLDRASIMPFSPANVLGLTMRQVGLERAEIGRIDAYTNQRRSRGELSEEEELSLATRRESLLTAQAEQITALSDGWYKRLPSMSAGLPGRFQGRYTTESMAANNLAMMGVHHIRAFGAANGHEIAAQDAMFDEVGAPRPGRATSPTQNTSNMGNSDKILAVLQQIAGLLAGGRAGGRAYEQMGQAATQLSRTQLGGNQGGTGAN